MRHGLWLKSALLPLLLAPVIGRAQTGSNPVARNVQAVNEGRELFAVSCAPCHGRNGEGGQAHAQGMTAPDLTRGTFKAGTRDADLFAVISKGSQGAGMPSFEPLGADAIWRLVAFVRSLSRPETTSAGDPIAGEVLFWGKGDCGHCHAVGSRGTSLGPDLTRGSRRATPQRLKNSIVAPNDEITPGYEVVTIVTRDQKTITGLGRFYDDFSARVIDSNGNERTYLRDEVASMRREPRSIMPAGYGKLFNAAELDNLVAYIVKLRSEAALP